MHSGGDIEERFAQSFFCALRFSLLLYAFISGKFTLCKHMMMARKNYVIDISVLDK